MHHPTCQSPRGPGPTYLGYEGDVLCARVQIETLKPLNTIFLHLSNDACRLRAVNLKHIGAIFVGSLVFLIAQQGSDAVAFSIGDEVAHVGKPHLDLH